MRFVLASVSLLGLLGCLALMTPLAEPIEPMTALVAVVVLSIALTLTAAVMERNEDPFPGSQGDEGLTVRFDTRPPWVKRVMSSALTLCTVVGAGFFFTAPYDVRHTSTERGMAYVRGSGAARRLATVDEIAGYRRGVRGFVGAVGAAFMTANLLIFAVRRRES